MKQPVVKGNQQELRASVGLYFMSDAHCTAKRQRNRASVSYFLRNGMQLSIVELFQAHNDSDEVG